MTTTTLGDFYFKCRVLTLSPGCSVSLFSLHVTGHGIFLITYAWHVSKQIARWDSKLRLKIRLDLWLYLCKELGVSLKRSEERASKTRKLSTGKSLGFSWSTFSSFLAKLHTRFNLCVKYCLFSLFFHQFQSIHPI